MSYDTQRAQRDPEYRARKTASRTERLRRQRERERAQTPTWQYVNAAATEQRARVDAGLRAKLAIDRAQELERVVAAYEHLTEAPIKRIAPAKLRKGTRPGVAVALLGDIHAEERVVRTPAIPNEYSLEIAERRVMRFFEGVIWLVKHAPAFDVRVLVLAVLGDLITGSIHEENLETAEVPPALATILVRDWLVMGIRRLLTELPAIEVKVPCSWGNHSRTTHHVRPATGYGHSWEWLMYQILAREFEHEPRVQIHASRDRMQYLTVFDYKLAFAHGDQIQYKGGLGGLTVPAIKMAYRWDKWRDVDFYHFGHFHTRIDLGQIAFNGSVIGPSPYGFDKGLSPEVPQQSFYVLDAKRGKTMSCPIWVAE